MKKTHLILGVLVFALLAMPFALADTLSIGSDDNVEWSADGVDWYPAYNTWVHPAWPSIYGASWIWRTSQTDPAEEYANVPDGGWYFRKTFDIPGCVDEENLVGTVTAAADNSYEMYFNGAYVDGRGTMDKNGPDAQSWRLKQTSDLTGLVNGENEILFRALNYYSHGSYSSNPAGLIFQIEVEFEEDYDDDGICGGDIDMCLDTKEDTPLRLGTNRWIWDGTEWITGELKGKGVGPKKSFTIQDTHGCSCEQILDYLHENYPEEYGKMKGHRKFGCSSSVMDAFLELTSE
ncbi:hypothetical protein KAT80_00265 [Candidatus Pacearchaeota archaeon]|nr:hypothetical protein [Candidatus Pacearchaeota archaeon]